MQGKGAGLPDSLVLRPSNRIPEGRSYSISGFIPIVPEDLLKAAGDHDPQWVREQYAQPPADLPDRVAAHARAISGEGKTRYEKAVLIRDSLRVLPVDFDIPDTPPGRDTVDYFLFDLQRGYFDYHASAMAVMLRTLGIPSRFAAGFVIGDEDKNLESGAYSIRDFNAYAWTEVYFPGYGWIAFNPTPGRSEMLNPVIEESTTTDEQLGLEDFPGLPVTADPIFDIPTQTQGGDGPLPSVGNGRDYNPLITLGVAAFIALLAGSIFLGWQRSVAGLPYPQQLWEKSVRLATWAGHGPRTGQTPAEFARSLRRRVPDAEDISVLAGAYNRSRFGRGDPEQQHARLKELWSPLRNALLGAILQRVTRRGRRRNEDA
jgi:hypothetical protein